MRVLLDTHVFLWALTGSARLKAPARQLLIDAEAVYVSAASIWEIAIKSRLGKIDADPIALSDAIEASGFIELPVAARHAAAVANLAPIHADPFDRLLVAQALGEPLRLITSDPIVARYSDIVTLV